MIHGKRVLVVVAHPDDELLGLGGTLHTLIHKNKCQVHCVILGEGITSRGEHRSPEEWDQELKLHRANINAAKEKIGYQSLSTYNFPDNRFDDVNLLDIIKVVEKEKNTFKPEVIFTHHGGDLNIDHQLTFQSVMTAARPMEHEITRTILCFETPSGTEWQASNSPFQFNPNYFVEISQNALEAKISGMESYEYEKRAYPHPRSPEALRILAQRWGVAIGRPYAEAFALVRHLSSTS